MKRKESEMETKKQISLKIPELSFDDLVQLQHNDDVFMTDEDQIRFIGLIEDLEDAEELAANVRYESRKYLFLRSQLIHAASDMSFYKFEDAKECRFFCVNAEEEILETAESPTKLFEQYDFDLGFVAHQIKCSWDVFLVGYDDADELPDTSYEDRGHADLIRTAKKLNIPITWSNPDLSPFEVCILFPVSDILDYLEEDQQDLLLDCDDDDEEFISNQYAKLSVGSGSIVGLKDFMQCIPDNFWDAYYQTSNTSVFLLKFWNSETCTLIHV